MIPTELTIRVYGLLIKGSQILLSKEYIKGQNYIKLPGGGLEFGEGILDCLKREFMEELNLPIEIKNHFYTTEGYFPSAFNPSVQVISIYYIVTSEEINSIRTKSEFETEALKKFGDQIVFWRSIDEINLDEINLPIDKIVLGKLKREPSTH